MYIYYFLCMYTDRHEYSTAPPRPPQARKHGKNYAETKWPSCPTKGRLRRDGLTGSHAEQKKNALNIYAEAMRKCFCALCHTSRKMGPPIFCDRSPADGKQASAQTPKEPGGPATPGLPACPA